MVAEMVQRGVSERPARRTVKLSRASYRYLARLADEDERRRRAPGAALTRQHARYGYRRIATPLRRQGHAVNHKERAMPIYEFTGERIRPVQPTTFTQEGIHERRDLQRLLRESVDVIAPNTLVVAEEFSRWEGSSRRIDLLGIDGAANLVVIELKRTEEGDHMELQALRYAAMVSTMTFEDAVDTFGEYLRRRGRDDDARLTLLDHLGWDDEGENAFNPQVRIVLASMDFDKEITSTVLWLNDTYSLDIRCVRIRPYRFADRLLVDVQQIIPLPEAAEYRVQLQKKAQQERVAQADRGERHALRRAFWTELLAAARERTPLHANISPSQDSWVAAGSGRAGLSYQYVIRRHEGEVYLYIDRGKRAEAENQALFEALLTKKDTIEHAFGGPLDWVATEGVRVRKVGKRITVGGYRDEDLWPDIQASMIDAMVRLEVALRPHLVTLPTRREGITTGDGLVPANEEQEPS